MKKDLDLKAVVQNLSKLGVNASITKSRLEILKVLTPPAQNAPITNS